jgi:PAS domain S-box-containing protein
MSEFTKTFEKRLVKLKEVAVLLLETGNARSFIIANKDFIPTVVPSDFIPLFDEIIKDGYKMEDIKILTNKILNIFHIPIKDFERIVPEPDTFLYVLEKNNAEMELRLNKIRPVFKSFTKDPVNKAVQKELLALIMQLEIFVKHYTIKENVLFPILEQSWPDYRCLQIMWSFQDDIRRNINSVIFQLREEHILFPHILSKISERQLEEMNKEGLKLGYPYINPDLSISGEVISEFQGNLVNLGTGKISLEQIKLIFNHLPVDITFVDENNRVCYFSTPPHRIFTRTAAIIGREVRNCHPPESVHVVEQIIESFRNGKKDHADFWIKMKGEFILIQYFAIRDEKNNYKGVIEVSQEISGIKSLEGEKSLLDW